MLYPVIMAGGSGTRFWPKSRLNRPKQLIQIFGAGTMIQQTIARLRPDMPLDSFLIVTNAAQAEETRRQLPQLAASQVLGEPVGRDTAAAIGLGALCTLRRDSEAVMVVLAADQTISPPRQFLRCVKEAGRIAEERHALVTFGIKPTYPSELYGYLRRGERLDDPKAVLPAFKLLQFKEKPKREQAEAFLRAGEYYWNSGNFAWRAADILEAIRRFLPELYAGLERIRPHLGTPQQEEVLAREYPSLPKISIDYGVMEKAPNAVVLEAELDWDDVGSWEALARHLPADDAGNVVQAPHAGVDTRDCIVVSEGGHLVATVGVQDLIVVHTPDATLVCDRRRVADVKKLVEQLQAKGFEAFL